METNLKVEILLNTKAKPGILQSVTYDPSQIKTLQRGTVFPIKSYTTEGNHVRVDLLKPDRVTGRDHHYFYTGKDAHVKILGNLPKNDPSKEAAKRELAAKTTAKAQAARADTDKGQRVYVVGLGYRYLNDPIDGTRSFYWYEALRNGARIPEHGYQALNIIHIAKLLQKAKDSVLDGAPMIITSWLRPAAINRAVGGSSVSTHVSGSGVDWYIPAMSEREVYSRLERSWDFGLAVRDESFLHTDTGRDAYDRLMNYRRRWNY